MPDFSVWTLYAHTHSCGMCGSEGSLKSSGRQTQVVRLGSRRFALNPLAGPPSVINKGFIEITFACHILPLQIPSSVGILVYSWSCRANVLSVTECFHWNSKKSSLSPLFIDPNHSLLPLSVSPSSPSFRPSPQTLPLPFSPRQPLLCLFFRLSLRKNNYPHLLSLGTL